jgi:hypothetical protein
MSSELEFESAPSLEGIEQILENLAKEGLIADSGRRRWSKQSGCYKIVWVVTAAGKAALADESAWI